MEDTSELTLLLLYLTSWEEREFGGKIRRSWKGYPFEDLNKLNDIGFISSSKTAKSVYLSEEGIAKAREIAEKYLGKAG